jgi:hypothetical protein
MLEAGIVAGAVAVLSGGVWAWSALTPDALLASGLWMLGAGLAFGVPTGLLYHVLLHQALAANGRLPARWWLRPTSLHDRLPAGERPRILLWCQLGALGCVVAFVGCGVFALGAFRLLADG